LLSLCATLAIASVADARALRAPALVSPGNGSRVQQLPAINWNAVRGAAAYEYQVAADPRFNSIALGRGAGKGTGQTYNLSATLDKTVPNGTYYWRVRGLTAKDKVGSWSRVRRIVKSWSTAPQITGGNGVAVSWPSQTLVLRWSSVPYANKYIVSVATDPALSNLVIGSQTKPTEIQGIHFSLPTSLAPGPYYWAITPVDAEGHRGVRSALATFQWAWPTTSTTSLSDLNPEAGIFDDPMFSWNPVPGAARYEVEVNSAEGFPPGSKWCCTGTTTGTSLAPMQALQNNRYYWRVRALDARGNAGVWNEGQSFTKAFDPTLPSVRNLTVRNFEGAALSGAPATSTPIVTWDPVPGASRYEVQLGLYNSTGHFCDWTPVSNAGYHADTATTAWTPLATGGRPYSEAWPSAEGEKALTTGPEAGYCVRVNAHSDSDARQGDVTSEWTYLNSYNNAAFTFTSPPEGSSCTSTPADAYVLPGNGSQTTRTPYFTWHPVSGAGGYYVVIARDAGFTQVVDIGFTNVNAYAPRLAKKTPLSDETTAYYWAVMPSEKANGAVVCSDPPHDNPQSFNKSSAPPQPLTPSSGSAISTQPSFHWTAAENARTYHLQVAQDPTFGAPIDDVTTDATAYTSSSTYPADTVLYWRVRANDWNGQGLNWSPTQTFVRRLPVPALDPLGATTVLGIPPVTWSPVQGAIAYDMHVEQADGRGSDFTSESPSATVTSYYGTGIVHYQVRAEFPTNAGGKVAGAYSARGSSLLILAAPRGVRGTRSGSRLLVSWQPEADAKQYQVEISTTNGFNSRIETHRVDGTSWAPSIDLRKKRGTLYWRVAPVDQRGGIGSFASGAFKAVGSHKSRCAGKRHNRSRSCKRH
jgi:hypothetical protein